MKLQSPEVMEPERLGAWTRSDFHWKVADCLYVLTMDALPSLNLLTVVSNSNGLS